MRNLLSILAITIVILPLSITFFHNSIARADTYYVDDNGLADFLLFYT